ncbi:MAG: hypothetical protein KC544_13395 [Gemmatimonadetes bacterium]|nr:hypothetical protein [Gemmatimonadota bacterium]
MLGSLLLYLGLLAGAGYLGLRIIRALVVGRSRPSNLAALAEEIEGLREQQQFLTNQILALRDGQEFARQLRTAPPDGGES